MKMKPMLEMVSIAASIPLDAANYGAVGLSRRATSDQTTAEDVNKLELEKTITQSNVKKENTQPFTPAELSKAMTAATIGPDR